MRIKEKAFTLVELLVVISIIAMLMGILMPALNAARRNAYKTGCKKNLHNCALAFRMYLDDYRNTMPDVLNMTVSTKSPESVSLFGFLGKYLLVKEALKCPADKWPEKNSSYFKEEGTSYEYNRRIAGEVIERTRTALRFGTNQVWMIRDCEPFHGKAGRPDSRNWLFADTLVADRERNAK